MLTIFSIKNILWQTIITTCIIVGILTFLHFCVVVVVEVVVAVVVVFAVTVVVAAVVIGVVVVVTEVVEIIAVVVVVVVVVVKNFENVLLFVSDNHSDVHHRGHRDQLVRHCRRIRKALEKSFPTSLAHLLRTRSSGKMMTCSFSNGFNVLFCP